MNNPTAHPACEATDRDMEEVDKTIAKLTAPAPDAVSVAREIGQLYREFHGGYRQTVKDEVTTLIEAYATTREQKAAERLWEDLLDEQRRHGQTAVAARKAIAQARVDALEEAIEVGKAYVIKRTPFGKFTADTYTGLNEQGKLFWELDRLLDTIRALKQTNGE
jgi:hypothetical protein